MERLLKTGLPWGTSRYHTRTILVQLKRLWNDAHKDRGIVGYTVVVRRNSNVIVILKAHTLSLVEPVETLDSLYNLVRTIVATNSNTQWQASSVLTGGRQQELKIDGFGGERDWLKLVLERSLQASGSTDSLTCLTCRSAPR